MKLNSFGETIRRIEAERLAQAQAAVEAGWTEADHPTKCCPTEKQKPQPKRAGRPIEELQLLHDRAKENASYWADRARLLQEELERIDRERPKFDHGTMQVALKTRQKGMNRETQLWKDTEHAKERAAHYRRLTKKYQDQINRRSK